MVLNPGVEDRVPIQRQDTAARAGRHCSRSVNNSFRATRRKIPEASVVRSIKQVIDWNGDSYCVYHEDMPII